MIMSFTWLQARHIYIISIQISFSTCMVKQDVKRWFGGRTPPSSFEYPSINGFYSPKQAQIICERDIQCGGFTFKGAKNVRDIVPEVYFFHFIHETSNYLTTEIEHPHWTSYIVGSRDYIIISGIFYTNTSGNWRNVNRYVNFMSKMNVKSDK